MHFDDLTEKDKKESLDVVNLIAQNRCGKIKGRTCTNRSQQRRYVSEGESFASPTASLESMLTTLMFDAFENRDVAVADVPRAYLYAEFPAEKRVILKLCGTFVNIMCQVNSEYNDHIV